MRTAFLVLLLPLSVAQARGERTQLDEDLHRELEKVAVKCEQLKLPQLAKKTRGYFVSRDPNRTYIFLPDRAPSLKPRKSAPKIHGQWFARLMRVRRAHAEKLFQLAKRKLDNDQPTLAFQLVNEVLYHDPDHRPARQVLGYRKSGDKWTKATRIVSAAKSRTRHPKLGFARGTFWRIRSTHFRITTNHSRQEGIRLANRLEDLHAVWQQMFYTFWSSSAKLKAQFAGRGRAGRIRPRFVVLFRDKQDYVNRLIKVEPRIGLSVGLYLQKQREAYFYAGDPAVESTWLHEATHQLFHESFARPIGQVGTRANFWIVEGIAMYMESLCQHRRGYFTVGGFDADRLQYARYRRLSERFYVPLAQLVKLNRQTLQAHPQIRRLYSQSAGMAHFLMNSNGGRWRDSTLRYLHAIYQQRDRVSSLGAATGMRLNQLDQQYQAYLRVIGKELAFLNPATHVRRLALGHCDIADSDLLRIQGYRQLTWLDLSFTKVSDASLLKVLPSLVGLQTLNLENASATNKTLAAIGKLGAIQELDLSGTGVTNQGMPHLAKLKNLTVLWLTKTAITDAALTHLYGLTKLEELDVQGCQVTAAGLQRLRSQLPKLKINGK